MNRIFTVGAALMLTTTAATAGGLDRSGQPVDLLFEDGNRVELNYGSVSPDLSGVFTVPAGPAAGLELKTGNVAETYSQVSGGVKYDVNDALSFALILDQPFGADIKYDETDTRYPLAGSTANVASRSLTVLARSKLNQGFSIHGGLRYLETKATLREIAGVYSADVEKSNDTGYVVGAAYERPDIALRLAVTYSSELDLSNNTSVGPGGAEGSTDYVLPQSVNIDFQTGIAENTLLFGSIRWAEWTETSITPFGYTAGPLVSYDSDVYTYTLGVGRQLTDSFSGAITVGYEAASDDLVSNLSPTDGNYSIGLGGTYEVGNGFDVSVGARYIRIGDATTRSVGAEFADNTAVGVGVSVGYSF